MTNGTHLNSVLIEGIVDELSNRGMTLRCIKQYDNCETVVTLFVRCPLNMRPTVTLGCTVRIIGKLSMDVLNGMPTLAVYPEYVEVQL